MTKTLAAMLDDRNNRTYYNSLLMVIQHGGNDVSCKRSIYIQNQICFFFFSESQTIALRGCVSQAIFRKRLPWSHSCETSKNILNARFVLIPTTTPKRYHAYTHFAVSVWRIMQEPATGKESSVVQSAKRKSICPKEIVSTVYRPVFSTTVC